MDKNFISINLNKGDIIDIVKENITTSDILDALCEDEDWLKKAFADALKEKVKITKEDIIDQCVTEVLHDIYLEEIEKEIKARASNKLIEALQDKLKVEVYLNTLDEEL